MISTTLLRSLAKVSVNNIASLQHMPEKRNPPPDDFRGDLSGSPLGEPVLGDLEGYPPDVGGIQS